MNQKDFHDRLKEILQANRDERNSPNEQFHDVFDNQVKQRSGKDWDEAMAEQVLRELEWATNTQPKRDDISEAEIKTMLSDFMTKRDYTVTPIAEGANKTPDCYIEKGRSKYLGEIKSPVLNFDIKTQLYKFKTSHTKILDHIHKAVKQFTEQDPNHELPWVLIFTSSHPQLNWSTFTGALQGGVINQKGERNPDFSKTDAYASTVPLIGHVDAFIWLQANGKSRKFHQASYVLNYSSLHKVKIDKLINDLSSIKLPNHMDLTIQYDVKSDTVVMTQLK